MDGWQTLFTKHILGGIPSVVADFMELRSDSVSSVTLLCVELANGRSIFSDSFISIDSAPYKDIYLKW